MTLNDTFCRTTPPSPIRGDLLRLAFIAMLFANIALGLTLAARVPGAPLAAGPVATESWHGNSAGHAMR